jgi:hypothetical protein
LVFHIPIFSNNLKIETHLPETSQMSTFETEVRRDSTIIAKSELKYSGYGRNDGESQEN